MPHGLLLFTGFMELIGGALIVLGLFTRPSPSCSPASWRRPISWPISRMGFFPALNYGEAAVLYCFAFLYLATSGAGPISLDATLSGSDKTLRPVKS